MRATVHELATMRGNATRLRLLSKVGELAGILDYADVLVAVARLSVPELADCCIVDAVGTDGAIRRAEFAHRNPASAARVAELRALDTAEGECGPDREAVLSRRSLLVPEYTDEVAREHGWSLAHQRLARELGARSLMVVPLVVRGAVIAVSAFLTTAESDRRYGEEDLALAEELAHRTAEVVESARLHAELRKSEQRFRMALANTHVTLFEKDRDLRFRWAYNPLFGNDPAEMIGKTDADFVDSKDVAAQLEARQRAVLVTGEASRDEVQVEIDGETRHVVAHAKALRAPSDDIVGLTLAVSDITEQKRAQEALAEAIAFRERILRVLGHELRNPLAAVQMLSTLLLRREDLPADAREQVARIDRARRRMLELIGTLLDFSESRFKGEMPVAPEPADLHEVVRAVVEELRAAHPGHGIELATRGDGRGRWDAARMAQVVSNLVGNAITHGGRTEPVRVTVDGGVDALRLVVRNGGAPIPPDLLPVLFEPFRRGAGGGASQVRGLGLGLYIAKQIVSAHGGDIEVRSTAEDGTTFVVRVPRWSETEAVRDPRAARGARASE
jgi:PAS domain S-box-containing protein